METGQSAAQFKTTSWTLVLGSRENSADLEDLLKQYWSPVYAYLRRKGHQQADAADLTQAFLARLVEDRKLLDRADPTRGRFRSFLLHSLRNFVIDEYRQVEGRDRKQPIRFVSSDQNLLQVVEPRESDDPVDAFDRQWATTVLTIAVERIKHVCSCDGMERQWQAFERRVLRPIQQCSSPEPIDSVVEALNARDSQEIYSMVQTVKRKFSQVLRDVVSETVADPNEVETELNDLKQFLSI